MQQNIQQPATHSLLRQSQRRRQSFSPMQLNPSPINNLSHNPQNTNNSKYHYNYSRSSNLSSHKKGISSSLYESKYLSKNKLSPNPVQNSSSKNLSLQLNMRHSMIVPSTQEKIVVCQSLPKTRPKYSFTFSNLPPNQSSSIAYAINTIPNTKNNSQPILHTPRANLSHAQSPSSHRPSQRSPDIRKNMDLCLYAISDKLKQVQFQQQQTKNFLQSKFKNVQDTSYRPSISQIRKNKKMYLDKSIHRIHPEIVNEYIETVYREYDIPDPLKSGNRGQGERIQGNLREIAQFEIRPEKEQNKGKKQIFNQKEANRQLQATNIVISTRQQRQTQVTNHPLNKPQKSIVIQPQPPSTHPHQLPQKPIRQQYYPHNSKFPSHQNNRKNNLISSFQQHQGIKNRKKKFLDLTLSKQKQLNPKTFNSPTIEAHKPGARHQHSSRSQSNKSRHSSSQKKILQIKKNIATWNDNQHQYAERYSYIESPYEVIRQEKRQHIPSGNIEQNNNAPINIRIKPFQQLMKATFPTQANQQFSTKGHNTTQHSQFLQSKYVQSYFTQQGQVMEEFRFCVLCQLPVLSANILRHQQKCIGWIDHKGKLVGFRDLYRIEREDELKEVIKGKIAQIKKRIVGKITQLKEREKLDPEQKSNLTMNIMHSVENLVETFILMAEFDVPTPQNTFMFSSGYKKIQKNYKNQYILLLQQSKKLHWFVKLLENYQRRLDKMNTTNVGIRNEKGFTSTKAKHNQSLTFIQQEESHNNQVVSEFGSQREQQ